MSFFPDGRMEKTRQIEAVASALKGASRILVLTHKNPDGDALGSALALSYALSSIGKEVDNVNIDGVPAALSWLEGADLVRTTPRAASNYDLYLLLDCNELGRTGFEPEAVAGIPGKAVIDHHPMPDTGDWPSLVDPKAAASGHLVYEVIEALGAEITPSVAQDLYVALHTDTGGFRFSNTTADTFDLAAKLVRAGAVPAHVAVMLLEREDAARMKLLGLALGTLETDGGGRVAHIRVTEEMFRETGTKDEHTDGFVNYPRSVEGVEVALLFKEKGENLWRIALRSRGLVDVSQIARALGGGGHRNASGVTLSGTFDEVTGEIIGRVKAAIVETGLN